MVVKRAKMNGSVRKRKYKLVIVCPVCFMLITLVKKRDDFGGVRFNGYHCGTDFVMVVSKRGV